MASTGGASPGSEKQGLQLTQRPVEKPLGSSEEADVPQHAPKRSRAGRFPIKVIQGSDEPASFSRPLPLRSQSTVVSLHNKVLRGPETVPRPQYEREYSQSTSNAFEQQGDANRPEFMTNKRFGVQQLPRLQTTDGIGQHPRWLSLSDATSPNAQSPLPRDRPDSSHDELLDIIPINRPNAKQYDPVLEMARTVYCSIHRLHWLVQALSSLTSDGGHNRSSLEMVVYNANLHLGELGRQIQSRNGRRDEDQLRRACTVLIKAYIPICAQISRNVDILAERAEPRFVREFISLLYASIMGLRAEFLRSSWNPNAFGQTVKAKPGAPGQLRRMERSGNRGLSVRTSTLGQTIGPGRNGSSTPRLSPRTPLQPTPILSDGDQELVDQLCMALRRLCTLIPETLPDMNQGFLATFDDMKGQRSAPHVLETWWSAINACSKVIGLSEGLSNSLESVNMKGPPGASFRDLCYRFIDAWTAFGDILKASKGQLGLEADVKKRLQQIQQAVKEVMNRLMAVSSIAVAQPASSSPSVPLTPQQATLGPAIQSTVSSSS
ncbi:hypothetical protein FDECE_4357 [Fusarium decemcellulare]|nr:hypothetical protein FDECE_4357 [Fusarium decemcellulare]